MKLSRSGRLYPFGLRQTSSESIRLNWGFTAMLNMLNTGPASRNHLLLCSMSMSPSGVHMPVFFWEPDYDSSLSLKLNGYVAEEQRESKCVLSEKASAASFGAGKSLGFLNGPEVSG